ncbi:MAG: sulfatase-like hydrolase/transferase [Pseudomonadaceae bacterium]|nr:sulfatase-like hydrolase/transferase [Pseudomonadaceae bacterium]
MKHAAACLLVLTWFGCLSAAASTPNLLLIYVDDLGYGDLGHYGHPVIKTPNIDQLAASGVTLTQYYAPSPLCSPSRAALLTGRHPYRTGIQSWIPHGSGIHLKDEELTLAEMLADNGYQTALIGKWHLNSDLGDPGQPQPNDQGFEYFYGHNAFQIPTNRNPTNIYRNREALPTQIGYTAQLYADESIAWLEKQADKPFFLMLSMAEPHTSIENPVEYNNMYKAYSKGPIIPIISGNSEPPKDKLIPRGPGEYYANVTYMDAQIGRVLSWLKHHPDVEQNTIVVFASDNGPVTSDWINWWEVNAYGSTGGFRGRKHYLYEGGIRVPAIIRYPDKIAANSRVSAPVIGTDLFSTLLSWLEIAVPSDRPIDGQDITSVLAPTAGNQAVHPRDFLWALPSESPLEFAVRSADWKLMLDAQHEPRALFDLATDPLELFNLIREHPQQVDKLRHQFLKGLAAIRADPLLNQ